VKIAKVGAPPVYEMTKLPNLSHMGDNDILVKVEAAGESAI